MKLKNNCAPVIKLKGLRAERLLTQQDMAKALGMSTATYNRKENGLGMFNANEILILTEFFGIKFENIFPRGY